MPKIDKNIVDTILSRARIEEVVGDFVQLKKKGVRYLGLCPFHDDRHIGSFVVYPKGNCYKCFKCEAKGGVVDFLMKHEGLSYPDAIRWLGKKYNIETDMTDFNYTPPPPRPAPPPLEMLTLPMSMVTSREDTSSDALCRWIRQGIRWDVVQRSRVEDVLKAYHVGHAKGGHTIFWQIDERQRVHTGKMMKYKADGHRDREASWNFDFIHSSLSRRYDAHGRPVDEGPWPYPKLFNPDKQEAHITLFGLHLLNKWKKATVNIVESEKTALLMAIAYGNNCMQIWMACGGMSNLTRERLAPIISQSRRIVLYPDRDGIQKWREQAERLHYDRLTVDDTPVTKWWEECDGPKADIADVVIRCINGSDWHPKTIEEVGEQMPAAKPILEKFDLEIMREN